jgi:hypothetical protein
MGMSSFVIDMEEQFYGGAEDVKLECNNLEEYLELMMRYRDQVSHQLDHVVIETLKEIWHG